MNKVKDIVGWAIMVVLAAAFIYSCSTYEPTTEFPPPQVIQEK